MKVHPHASAAAEKPANFNVAPSEVALHPQSRVLAQVLNPVFARVRIWFRKCAEGWVGTSVTEVSSVQNDAQPPSFVWEKCGSEDCVIVTNLDK